VNATNTEKKATNVNKTIATPIKAESAPSSEKATPVELNKPEFAPKSHEHAKSDDPKNEVMHKDE
jgi:hypothetical protein